jgi:Flp pilus assembly protein TadG
MIRRRTQTLPRNAERGVTMLLVVIAMLSMLAMVALAIDVITLYSAHSETQRVADAAALAAAKVLVDAGVTADPGDTTTLSNAQTLAIQAAKDVGTQLVIAARQVQATDVTVSFPNGGNAASFGINPQVSVSVQNAYLPAFFSRIWSRSPLTVSASATAEGFNPSNSSSLGTGTPVIAKCVKPFIIPNCDPVNANNKAPTTCGGTFATFFSPTTGAITNPGVAPTGVIGEEFDLVSNCGPGPACTPGTPSVDPAGPGGPTVYYYPAVLPSATNACPSCTGATNFEQDIECCNPSLISCGTTATAPIVDTLTVDTTVYPEGGGGPAQEGVQCLIHQTGGSGMDTLNSGPPLTYPLQIQVGNGNPLKGSTNLSVNDYVTTSDSLVTIPVYDNVALSTAPTATSNLNIIGFLQVFIVQAFPAGGGPKAGEFHVKVINVSGCGSSATGTAVAGAGTSAVPIRLIHQ